MAITSDKFRILNIEKPDDWDVLKGHLVGYIANESFDEIKSYFGNPVKSLIIESDYICKDYRDSYHNFYSKKFAKHSNKCVRLHFFNKKVESEDSWTLDISHKDNYIGYIILRPTMPYTVGRTILSPVSLGLKDLAMVLCKTEVNVLGSRFEVESFPFMGQDTNVSVCAHAAIWMVLRCFSSRYPYYKEIYPFQISKMTTDVSTGRLLPSKGLTLAQISEIFSNYGMYPDIYIRKHTPNFERILYYYIESGIPLVAGVGGSHAVSIFGHLLNLNYAALPEYECNGFKYYNSADLTTGFVINDDNHLPYYSLLKNPVAGERISKHLIKDIDAIVIPLYEKIFLPADAIEKLVETILSHEDLGFKKLSKAHNSEQLIVRIFLTSARSYKRFRRDHPVYAGIEKTYLSLPMPKFVWIAELSTLDKYKNKKVIGELIFDSTANKDDVFSFMYIHYPGFLLINDRENPDNGHPKISTLGVDLKNIQDYDMYESNLRGKV